MPQKPDSHTPKLPSRPANGHKGTFGRAVIIAGSRGMSGAACLAGTAALRGGAGLVSVACPSGIQPVVAGYEPGYMTVGLPDDRDGRLAAATLERLSGVINGKDSVAIGPGLGQSTAVADIVRYVFTESHCPLVLDADGLNVLADSFCAGCWDGHKQKAARVLTPHPGEFARLTGLPVSDIEQRRGEVSREFASKNGVILVLKGPGTIVTDGQRFSVNTTGNSGMATGGSGDVLAGLTAALLAGGDDAYEMTRLAVHLHGLAGDLAAAAMSQSGMIASDLPRYLCDAWKLMRDEENSTSAGE